MPLFSLFRRMALAGLLIVSLDGCFLLDVVAGDGGGSDVPPDTRLLVSDGQRLHWLGYDGLETATEPFQFELSTRYLATNADRSRVVIAGVDTEAGEHNLWILQRGSTTRLVTGVVATVVEREARWIWVETEAGQVGLYHHDDGGVPAALGAATELELLEFSGDGVYAVLREGEMVRLVYPGELGYVTFDPGMGAGWSLAAVRPNGLLLVPEDGSAGTWFDLLGAAAGAEGTVTRLGFTVTDGALTWRTASDFVNVATGLPDDLDSIVASDLGVVLGRRGDTLLYFDYAGAPLGEYTPEPIAAEEDGPEPEASVIRTVVPSGARQGVLVVEHTPPPDEAGAPGEPYATVHDYRLSAENALTVRMISRRTASLEPGTFGHHQASEYVAWTEAPLRIAYHDMSTGETTRLTLERELHFEGHQPPAHRHY